MGLTLSGEFNDVLEGGYVSGTISVTSSQIEAKVGGSPLVGRETVRIYNNSDRTIYFGPSGVTSTTGEPILKKQWVSLDFGETRPVYLITASGTASDVRVQEIG